MKEKNRWGVAIIIWLAVVGALSTVPMACKSPDATFTVGILNSPKGLEPCVDGFKAGMAEFGYSEGTIQYVYNGPVSSDPEVIDAEIARLLSRNIDLLFTTGNEVTLRAKEILEGTDIPIVFGASMMVVEQGIVSDMRHTGGNSTGVQATNLAAKAMEWVEAIIPGEKKVYLPYNPEDAVSILVLTHLTQDNSWQNIELILHEVKRVEEAVAAIERLPEDVDVVFRIPSPTLDPRNSELSRIAIERGLPIISSLPLDDAVLLSYGSTTYEMGKQASRLVHQIRLGIKPKELPIENGEIYFSINLQTAEKIGLSIPDVALAQAKRIIR